MQLHFVLYVKRTRKDMLPGAGKRKSLWSEVRHIMKKISDIRIYKSSDTMRPAGFASKELNIAVRRIVMKLREQNFSLGEFDHLYLNFTICRPVGTIELADQADRYHPWYRYCDIGVRMDEYENLGNSDRFEYIFENIRMVLHEKFCTDDITRKIVSQAIADAKKGASMRMRFKEKKSAKMIATIYLRLLDSGYFWPLLQVTDHDGNEILSVDLQETLDMNAIGEILLNSKKVTIKPRENAFANGLEPISFELQ